MEWLYDICLYPYTVQYTEPMHITEVPWKMDLCISLMATDKTWITDAQISSFRQTNCSETCHAFLLLFSWLFAFYGSFMIRTDGYQCVYLWTVSQMESWLNYRYHPWNQNALERIDWWGVCSAVWSCMDAPLPALTRMPVSSGKWCRGRCYCRQRLMGNLFLLCCLICALSHRHSFNLLFAFQFILPLKNVSPLGLDPYLLKSPVSPTRIL